VSAQPAGAGRGRQGAHYGVGAAVALGLLGKTSWRPHFRVAPWCNPDHIPTPNPGPRTWEHL
jgi:hypothetical protein